jgi:hypothetical protein
MAAVAAAVIDHWLPGLFVFAAARMVLINDHQRPGVGLEPLQC